MQPNQPPPLEKDPAMYAPGDGGFNEIEVYDDVISQMRDKTHKLEASLKAYKEKETRIFNASFKLGLGHTRIDTLHETARLLGHLRECPDAQSKSWAEIFLVVEATLRERAESTQKQIATELAIIRELVGAPADAAP